MSELTTRSRKESVRSIKLVNFFVAYWVGGLLIQRITESLWESSNCRMSLWVAMSFLHFTVVGVGNLKRFVWQYGFPYCSLESFLL